MRSLETISPDGLDRQVLVSVNSHTQTTFTDRRIEYPNWSPTSSHLVYRLKTWDGMQGTLTSDLFRVGADGRGKTNLTKDTDAGVMPYGWR